MRYCMCTRSVLCHINFFMPSQNQSGVSGLRNRWFAALVFSAVLGKTSVFVFAFILSGYDWKKCFYVGSVFCCHLEPKTGRLAATGAEDDMAYVWETHTGDVVLHCKGHKVGAVFVSHSV
jgi:hypothetical protein